MPKLPLPQGSNPQEYRELGDERLVNCFAEQISKTDYRVRRVPGSVLFSADTNAVNCRGALEADGYVYAVWEGGQVTRIDEGGTRLPIGHIGGSGPVIMARNAADPFQIGCVARDTGKYYVIENDEVSIVDTRDIAPFNSICWVSGYFVLGVADGRHFATGLNDAKSINGLDYATAEGNPDGLVGVFAYRMELVLLGERTTEFWGVMAEPGAQGSPFARLGGAVIPIGCGSILSACAFDNSFVWLGHDGKVYRNDNYAALRISHYGVERSIAEQADKSTIRGHSYSINGNTFYRLIGDSFTWTYSAATRKWHEEHSLRLNRVRAEVHVEAWNQAYYFTKTDGAMYRLTLDANDEAGQELPFVIRFPDLPPGVTVNSWESFMVTGRAPLTGASNVTGPSATLAWSDDGGATWQGNRSLTLGAHGQYGARTRATRMGRSGAKWGRRYELAVTDPHVACLSKVEINEAAL